MKLWRCCVVLAVFLLLTGMGAAVLSPTCDSTEACYVLNEGSSPSYDYSGNNYDGDWVGSIIGDVSGADFGSGSWNDGEAIDFNGVGYVNTSTTHSFPLSLSMWFYSTDSACDSGASNVLFADGFSFGSDTGFQVRKEGNGCDIKTIVGDTAAAEAIGGFGLNQWTCMVVTIESGGATEIFINGTSEASGTHNGVTGFKGYGSQIGGKIQDGTASGYWDGKIDEVKVYNKILNTTEINNVCDYNNIKGETNKPPTFNSNSTEPANPSIGDSVNVTANVTDDGNVTGVNASVKYPNGTYLKQDVAMSDADNDDLWQVNDLFTVPSQVDYVTVELDAVDDGGSTASTSFQVDADTLNEIRAESSDTSNTISDFTVTYTNGTETFSKSASSGVAQFWTSSLPTGTNNLTLTSSGYDTRVITGVTVDASYEVNQSFSMTPTSFTFEVVDEQTTSKQLHYNATFNNGTNSIDVTDQKSNSSTLSSGGTYDLGYVVANNIVVQLEDTYDTTAGGSDGETTLDLTLWNGTKVNDVCTFSHTGIDDTSNTIHTRSCSFNEKLVSKVTVDSNNLDYENIRPVSITANDTDKNGFNAEYNFLKNSGFPTGDLTVTASSTGYPQRTFYTTLSATSTVSLTAYLLKQTEGLYASVKVVDRNGDVIQNAQVTNQKLYGNTYTTVAQRKTSTTGTATFFLDPDTAYKVLVSKTGYVSFEGTWNPANYQFEPLTIQLGSASQFGFSTPWDGISVKIEPQNQTLPTKPVNITGTISDSDNSLTLWGLRIKNSTGNVLNSTNSTSPSGGSTTLSVNLSGYSVGDQVNATLFFTKDGTNYQYSRVYVLQNPLQTGDYSLTKVMKDFRKDAGPTVTGFLALLLTLLTATKVSSFIGREGGSFVTLIVLGVFAYTNWVNPFLWMLAMLAVVGMYAMRR